MRVAADRLPEGPEGEGGGEEGGRTGVVHPAARAGPHAVAAACGNAASNLIFGAEGVRQEPLAGVSITVGDAVFDFDALGAVVVVVV